MKGPSFLSLRASCLWPHATATLQTHSHTFSHLLSSWEKFPGFQLNLAGLLFPWKKLGKTQMMPGCLMRCDNIGSREISAKCPSCVWPGWSPGRKCSALTSNTPSGWSRPYPTQMSMDLPMLWSTILQLPKCIFTQCSQICSAEKDLSFNYPTQSTTFIGILPKFI